MGAMQKWLGTEVPWHNIDLSQLGGRIDMTNLLSTYDILGQATTWVANDVARVLARAEKVGEGFDIQLPTASYSVSSILDGYDKLH